MKKNTHVIAVIVIIVIMLSTHLTMLVNISKLQRDLNSLDKELTIAKKTLQTITSEFEKKVDFKEVRTKAEKDFGMEISDQIEYLRVD